jgi:hypothetical protein
MQIKHYDIDIPADDPFANCKLERKKYADVLTAIVSSFADGFVLAINNEWGTGKTTFVKMWKQQLENEGFKALYFNAWENDYEDDVLVALISELDELKEKKTEKTFKKVLDKAVPLSKKIVPGVLKTLAKKYVGDDFVRDLLNGTIEVGADEMAAEVNDYLHRKKGMEEFRDTLSVYVKKISEDKPVVFFIDELDRCRPDYAVKVLEQVKHLFSVPGIVFVLSIEKTQLSHAVKGFYGNDKIDASEYLRRFIDIEYSLPEPDRKLYFNYLYDYFHFDDFLRADLRLKNRDLEFERSQFINFITLLFEKTRATLRQQEKLLSHTRLVLKAFEYNQYSFPSLVVLLLYIKMFKKDLYSEITSQLITPQELIDKIEDLFPIHSNEAITGYFIRYELLLLLFYSNLYRKEKNHSFKLYENNTENRGYSLLLKSKFNSNKDVENQLNRILENILYHRYEYLSIDYLLNKIELTEPFKI